ncbi:MAG: hypothetical protein NC111_04075 [Bacteroides sp.]|nr:hypothetical protein [Bacteroides sp.]MCM1412981.1 hypothetical protein [Bacteroides sp.]MCM1471687.1 hypothetical protein [Bacteroides sp.]
MKKYINRLVILSGCAMAFAACDDNSWNDKLDGFEVPDKNASTSTIEYTMTQVDYASLAALSTAKAAAGDNLADLTAVGSQGYFTDVITAEDYIPYFLADERFPYFALSNGSSVKVTYETMAGQPAEVTGAVNAAKYTVTTDDYINAWGSDEQYAEAFAPSCTAARNIPTILDAVYDDAIEGTYVIVNYNQASTDPVFGGSAPETPAFELSDVLGTAATGQTLTVNGYVTAIDMQGFILTDKGGSIYCYRGNGYNDGSIEIGTQLTLDGTVASRNKSIQFGNAATFEVKGKQEVTYPTPKVFTGAELDALVAGTAIDPCTYVSMTGTVTLNGTNINLIIDGASTAKGSPSYCTDAQKALLTDGANVTVEGYWYAVAGNRYCSLCVTKVTVNAATAMTSRAATTVASTAVSVMYKYDGTKWAPVNNMTVLNHSDYQAMGQTYDNLSGDAPKNYLPSYLRQTYPYAQADDIRYVVYNYYNGSTTVTRCAECRYNGSEWVGGFNGTTIVTSQFVKKDGKWMYSPDVTITLPAGKGIAISTLYYQTCVDWVLNNVPNGAAYVSSYGNNEYYCGTSAYQGNVDLRPSAAKTQYPGYDSMTDDEVVALEKERFEKEVFPAALAILHPDAAPTAKGIEPEYTINFYYYDGTTKPATIIYKVTAPATFTYISCTWND